MTYSKIQIGKKLRTLRLKNDMTIKELSAKINVDCITLMHVELNKIKMPFYYWRLICDYFNINHIKYLDLNNMNESSLQDKTTKIRAFIGAKRWEHIGKYLGYNKRFIIEIRTRYKPNEKNLLKINANLDEFLRSFSVF